jgi:hypothetical protein
VIVHEENILRSPDHICVIAIEERTLVQLPSKSSQNRACGNELTRSCLDPRKTSPEALLEQLKLCRHFQALLATSGHTSYRVATYKYPILRIAIRVTLVRGLTCRPNITGIGSDANRTSVKMLIAIPCQSGTKRTGLREPTSVEQSNGSVDIDRIASCSSHRRLELDFPYCSDRQTLEYQRAETCDSEDQQEHYCIDKSD